MPAWVLFLALFSSALFSLSEENKVYLPADHVLIYDKKILVRQENCWHPISHLSSDEKGLYFDREENVGISEWVCGKCGRENWSIDFCLWCGYDR